MGNEDLERITILLQARDRDFARAMDRSNKLMARFAREAERDSRRMTTAVEADLRRLTNAAMNMGRAFLGGLAAGVVTATLGGISTNVRGVVAEMSNMAKEADRVGISLDWWQALERGFAQAGVKASEFTAAMTTFTARIGEAAEGSGRLHSALERNGIRLRRGDGELRSTIDLLRDYARAVGGARSEAERVRMVEDAFGRGGRSLANALRGGEEALDGFMRAARDGGLVIDEALIRRAEVLDDRWDDLTRKAQTFFKTLAVGGAVNLGLVADLDRIFGSAERAAAVLGEDLYDALRRNAQAVEDNEQKLRTITPAYDQLGRTVGVTANALGAVVADLLGSGTKEAQDFALGLNSIASEMESLIADVQAGRKPAADLSAEMAELVKKAEEALKAANAIDGISTADAVAQVARLGGALNIVKGYAEDVVSTLREAAGIGLPMSPGRGNGDAELERRRADLPVQWRAPRTSPRPRRAPNNIDALVPVVTRRSGGGARDSDYSRAVESIRDRTAALEAEALVLVAAASGNQQLGDAMEYARQRAQLLAAAKKEGRAITPELTAEIDQLALSYMTAGLEAEAAAQRIDRIREASEKGIDTLTDLFDEIFTRGASARQVLASLVAEMAKVQFRNALLGAASSGGGGFFGLLGNLLLPRRAGGGSARAGQPYLVNENTPNSEVFVPSQSGAVLNIPQAQAALRPSAQQGPQIVYVPQPYVAKVSADDDGRIIGTMHRIAASTTATGLMQQQRAMPSMLHDMQARGMR